MIKNIKENIKIDLDLKNSKMKAILSYESIFFAKKNKYRLKISSMADVTVLSSEDNNRFQNFINELSPLDSNRISSSSVIEDFFFFSNIEKEMNNIQEIEREISVLMFKLKNIYSCIVSFNKFDLQLYKLKEDKEIKLETNQDSLNTIDQDIFFDISKNKKNIIKKKINNLNSELFFEIEKGSIEDLDILCKKINNSKKKILKASTIENFVFSF